MRIILLLLLASVDFSPEPTRQKARVGSEVRVKFVAYSDKPLFTAGSQEIIAWDPALLELVGFDMTGAASQMLFGFPHADLNPGCEDYSDWTCPAPNNTGMAIFANFAWFGTPGILLDEHGTLLVTFIFKVIAEGDSIVEIIDCVDNICSTVTEVGGDGDDITYELFKAKIRGR